MATIVAKRNKSGEIISYKIMACVGRDDLYRQVWRTMTIKRPEGLTPAKEYKEVQRQADAWEQVKREEFNRTHTRGDKTKITLKQFVDEHWMPDHVKDGEHTPQTVAFYEDMSADILDYFGPRQKIASIDAEAVKRYIKWLRTDARTKPKIKKDGKPGKPGRPYAASTIQHHFSTLRNILRYAERLDYISKDPTRKLSDKEKPHREEKPVDFLATDDARRFLACLDEEPLFWRAFMNVLIITGLRRGECVGLQWSDFHADDLTLDIRLNVTIDKNAPGKIHIGKTKGKEGRTVPISARVAELLQEHRREQANGGKLLGRAYIFSSPGDPYTPIYPTTPTKWQASFVKRHKLPKVSPHDLRHTAATLALEAGANLKDVQTLLGHKDPATTMKFYAGISRARQRITADGIENLIG